MGCANERETRAGEKKVSKGAEGKALESRPKPERQESIGAQLSTDGKGNQEQSESADENLPTVESDRRALGITLRDVNSIRKLTQPLRFYYEFSSESWSQGSMTLRVAEYITTRQRCVIRAISKCAERKAAAAVKKMREEVAVLSKIDHPNVLHTYETLEDKNFFYIVSELYLIDEFQRFVSSGVSEAMAAKILDQVLSAVNHCHRQGIMHRNIRLENIVLQEPAIGDEAVLKLTGFSDACFFSTEEFVDTVVGSRAFIAPEVLFRKYTEKCDIWSCGVLLYYLLAGEFPFGGKCTKEALANIRAGKADFEGGKWRNVSPKAARLTKKMLKIDFEKRPSAEECLRDRWLRSHCQTMSDKGLRKSLDNLLAVRARAALKQAIMLFIIRRVIDKREVDALTQSFNLLDINRDGHISREELQGGLEKLMPASLACQEVEKIFSVADLNQNGSIDYSEFLVSSFSEERLLTRDNLSMAFRSLDRDCSGKISVEELRDLFVVRNAQDSEAVWREIVGMVDTSGDGEVDLEEFVAMMNKNFAQG